MDERSAPLAVQSRTMLDMDAPSSPSLKTTRSSTTMRFHATMIVRISGLYGLRWNCNVTAPPPFTKMSNLNRNKVFVFCKFIFI